MAEVPKIENVEQEEAWSEREGRHWVAYADGYDAMSQHFGAALLEAAEIGPSEDVLDVGCGCGAMTIAAAKRAVEGNALGVDLSEPMLDVARQRATDQGVANASFVKGDAQVYTFEEGSFDVAISRSGVMFFIDPVAAFANIRRGLRQSGRLAFTCWQDMLLNEWIAVIGGALATHVPLPDFGEPSGPGPFSFAERDRVDEVLRSAGFRDVTIEAKSASMRFPGKTPDEVEAFLRSMPVAEDMLKDAEPEAGAKALAAVREALEPRFSADGLELEGAAWIVTATA